MVSLGAISPSEIRIGDFCLDPRRNDLRSRDGRLVALRPRSFAVLKLLSQRRGQVVTKSEIMDAVWDDATVTEDLLTQCVADIRRALGDADHRLVRNVPRRGYLLAAEAHSETPLLPDAAEESGNSAAALRSSGPRPELAGPMPDRPSIAVLPFRPHRPDEPARMFAEGISTEIINDLARNRDMQVIAWFSSLALFAAGLDIPAIGQKLRVRYLVDGSVRRDDEEMHIDVQLIDAHNGAVAWAEKFTLRAEDIPRARNELVEKIAATLHSSLRGTEMRSALARPPRDLETYELVLRGIALKHQFNRQATTEGRALLTEAVRRDPVYAPAWLYLAYLNAVDCVLQLTGDWTLARSNEAVAQFERAIQLDPMLPAAYQGLSFLFRYKGDMERSLTLIRRAVELGPSDADNLLFLGAALLSNGHAEQAMTEIEKAIELNPIVPPVYSFPQRGGAVGEQTICFRIGLR